MATGVASVSLYVNQPPSPGICFAVNADEAYSDFTLVCEGWNDENLPLYYNFELISGNLFNRRMVLLASLRKVIL